MANITIGDLSKVRFNPMYDLELIFINMNTGVVYPDVPRFVHLEIDSTWRIEPKTQIDQFTMPRQVGYLISITAVIPYNNYNDMSTWIELLSSPDYQVSSYRLKLRPTVWSGTEFTQEAGAEADFEGVSNGHSEIKATVKVEKAEKRSRMIIELIHFATLNVSDPNFKKIQLLYNQVFGW